jgi:hypothetical protein
MDKQFLHRTIFNLKYGKLLEALAIAGVVIIFFFGMIWAGF